MRFSRFFQLKLEVFVVLLCRVWLQLVECHATTYLMTEHCGSLVDMADRHLSTLRLQLTDQAAYRPHLSCSLALRAPPQRRLTLVVQWLDIAAGRFSGACMDFLSVWEGELGNRTTTVEGLDEKICGNQPPPSVTSRGRSMTLHFDSNTVEHGAGFSLIVTAFHHGECSQEEFRCDNGRCIDERLKCDDDDNCGDDSDTCLLSVSNAALAIIVLTIVCCLVAGAAVLYCHRERIFGRKKCADTNDVYQPTTESTTASTIPDTAAA